MMSLTDIVEATEVEMGSWTKLPYTSLTKAGRPTSAPEPAVVHIIDHRPETTKSVVFYRDAYGWDPACQTVRQGRLRCLEAAPVLVFLY